MGTSIRVGMVGFGNCATALLEGISYYRNTGDDRGLMHPTIGPYDIGSIEPVVAFDVDRAKVGATLTDAAATNDRRFDWQLDYDGRIHLGPVLDGIGGTSEVDVADGAPADVVEVLVDAGVDVVVNYLPVGSARATVAYAEASVRAGCGFVNAIPVPLACDERVATTFEAAGQPLIGDDVKSQYGATILHRVLVRLASERGVKLDTTYQLNVGGNADFRNMLDASRLGDKKRSKTGSVTDVYPIDEDRVHIGPSDHIAHLGDTKVAYVNLEMSGFASSRISLDCKLTVDDSPNSAGVVVDAIRYAQIARDRGEGGVLEGPSAALMKSPPSHEVDDRLAAERCQAWVDGG